MTYVMIVIIIVSVICSKTYLQKVENIQIGVVNFEVLQEIALFSNQTPQSTRFAMRSIMIISFLTVLCLAFLIGPAASEEGGHICFRTIDANQDGEVTHEEFSRYFSSDPQKFLSIDTDKNGVLTHDEYHDMLGHGSQEEDESGLQESS